MRLRHKTLLAITCVMGVLTLAMYYSAASAIDSDYGKLEQRLTEQNLARVLNTLDDAAQQLSTKLSDWAAWDDTYDFMVDQNEEYVRENLVEEAYSSLGLNLVLYLSLSNEVVFSAAFDLQFGVTVPVPESILPTLRAEPALTSFEHPSSQVRGILLVDNRPMIFAARPIQTTKLDGEPRGTLVFARWLDAAEVRRIAAINRVTAQFEPAPDATEGSAAHVELVSRRTIAATAVVCDPMGRPAIRVRISQPREIHQRAEQTKTLLLVMLIICGTGFAMVMMWVLGRVVLRRTGDLSSDVSAIESGADPKLRVRVGGNDEISQLSRSINRMLDSLASARGAAEAASHAKSSFLANMSHEIRTPMTAILGYAELLLEGAQSPETLGSHVSTIRRNGEHLLTIINDILDLSKIEAGKMTVESIGCEPVRIAEEVLSLLQVRAAAKGLWLKLERTGPVPSAIRSDPVRLRQILLNLVGNALKFTDRGGVRLVMTLEAGSDGMPARMRFDVEDTGIGMTDAQLESLFRPFTQADASTTRRFGGTGLGLTICKTLAELLGGEIRATSCPGKGSVFTVWIATGPLENALILLPGMAPVSLASPEKPGPTGTPLAGVRVLLAEDGPDNRRLIQHHLRKAGAEPDLVENGRQAVDRALAELAAGRPYGVILMDMQMPVLDGYGAAEELRRAGYTGRIVALTAHAMESDRQKCLAAGCDDFLTKPIDRVALVDACRREAGPARPVAARAAA